METKEAANSITENLQPRINDGQVHLLCDPALVACSGVGSGSDKSGALPIISACLALPRAASAVPISDWLPGSLIRAWSSPNLEKEQHPAPGSIEEKGEPSLSLPDELARRGFLTATTAQWRGLARRVCRCGLGVLLDVNSCPDALAAGDYLVIGARVMQWSPA